MKQPTKSYPAFIEIKDSKIVVEIDGIDKPTFPSADYFNFDEFDFNEFCEIHHFGNLIYKIFQKNKEIPQKNANILFDFVEIINAKKSIGGTTIPDNYDFSDFDLSEPFLTELPSKKKGRLKLYQKGKEVEQYDYHKEVYSKWEVWSNKLGQFKNERIEKVLNNDASSLFEIGYNYKNSRLRVKSFISHRRLPFDTAIISVKRQKVENFYLQLNHLIHHEEKFNERKSEWERKLILYRKDASETKLFNHIKFDKKFITQIVEKHKKQASLFLDKKIICPIFKINQRLIIGLGSASVYETSITLHHIYGIPYIPASAVKGVVRSWIIQNVFSKNEKGKEDLKGAEERALEDSCFQKIFGTQNTSGKIIFFDAFPTQPPNIEVDVMTPHYGDYYSKENVAPTDTMSPNPIPFLTVADTPFQFILGSKNAKWLDWKIDNKTIEEWLKQALTQHGIGAKTAVGYGYMKT